MSGKNIRSPNTHDSIENLREEIEETYRGMLEVFYELDETYRGVIELATNLESDEQKIKMLTKGAGLGLWDWNPVNDDFNVTDEWIEIVGVSNEDLKGDISDWDNLIHPDDLANVRQARRIFLKGEKMFFHSEHRLKVGNDSWKWFLSNGRAIKTTIDGKPELVAGSVIDIDNRKRTEERIFHTNESLEKRISERTDEIERTNVKLMEEIREHQYTVQALRQARKSADAANKAKSVFLANMSHELRTPLHAILGFSQLMQKDSSLSNAQAKNLEIINNSGIYLQGLINDVLEVSKIEAGHISLNPVVFDFQEMLQDIESLFQVRVAEKALYFRITEIDKVPGYLFGDEGKLRQVLINLLGNAIKFTDIGGIDLEVSYDRSQKQPLRFLIKDTGVGIEPKDIKKLFLPFEQGMAGVSKGGSGLGLVISREYIDLMKGGLSINSEPGKGSEFSFTCQFEEELSSIYRKEEKQIITGLKNGSNSKLVLVVEDNDLNRSLLVQLLESMGFKTKEAKNGKFAVVVFTQEAPYIVLMDMRMPEMDGKTAMNHIRKLDAGKSVPIIFLTASIMDKQKDEILSSGADGLLFKPFRETELAEILKEKAGVAFTYEIEDKSLNTDDELALDLSKLSGKTRSNLHEAATKGNIIELRNMVEKIKVADPVVGNGIGDLVNEYNYKKLLKLLE